MQVVFDDGRFRELTVCLFMALGRKQKGREKSMKLEKSCQTLDWLKVIKGGKCGYLNCRSRLGKSSVSGEIDRMLRSRDGNPKEQS